MPWMRVTGRQRSSVPVSALAMSVLSVSALAVPVPALPASLACSLPVEDVEHVEVVRAYRILEVVGGLILGLYLPSDPNRPGQPPADERP